MAFKISIGGNMIKEKSILVSPFGVFVTISIIIMIFQYNISQVFSSVNYYDEIFMIIVFSIYIVRNPRINVSQLKVIALVFGTVFVGLIGNLLFSFQKLPLAIVGDILSVIKVPLVLLSIVYGMTQREIKYTVSHLCAIFRIYIYIAAITAVYAYITGNSVFFASERFGIGAYKFISQNAGIFGYVLIGMLSVMTLNKNPKKGDNIIKILALIMIALTTKGPQLVFVALYIFFYLFRLGKLRWYHIAAVGIIVVLLSGYQIQHYIKPTEARYALTVGSLKIARDYFPIGTGFATFGSEMSKAYNYSQVYDLYELNLIRGLNREYTAYVTDNYWPMIIGQFGFVVAVLFLIYYFDLFKKINKYTKRTIEQRQIFLAMFITFMFGSLGSAYLTAAEGVIDFVYIGMFLNIKDGKIDNAKI